MKPSRDISRLIEIMAGLRTPGSGCPWDLEQSFRTIAPYTIEEAYEVADAIARDDLVGLKDELGDLLLQVVFHARMAQEQGAFDFADVVETITTKLVRRHPHVFADAEGKTAKSVEGLWERIKAEEKAERGEEAPGGALAGVPVALPALTRALKLQDKAGRVGFD
ncbi:MAG TPA: nucleoside triphosphate pyrophosphohydrolase, partial [Pseudolabrys sp.]